MDFIKVTQTMIINSTNLKFLDPILKSKKNYVGELVDYKDEIKAIQQKIKGMEKRMKLTKNLLREMIEEEIAAMLDEEVLDEETL